MINNKIKAGQVSMVIILIFAILSNLYEVLGLSIRGVERIIMVINDASGFLSIICVCFFIVAILSQNKKYSLIVLCMVNIILVNRLYSNKKWTSIIEEIGWLIDNIDVEMVIFWGLVVLAVVYILHRYIKGRNKVEVDKNAMEVFEKNNPKTGLSEKPGATSTVKEVNRAGNNYVKNAEMGICNETETEDPNNVDTQITGDKEKNVSHENGKHIPFPIICSIAVLIFILLYFGRTWLGRWGIEIPDFLPISAPVLYCLVLFSATIMLCYIVAIVYEHVHRQLRRENSSFRISALIAVVLETALLLNLDKIDTGKLTNRFISGITENGFTSILAMMLLFLILQIACIIAGHVFFENNNSETSKLIKIMRRSMERIEEKMVKIAFNIIEGCVALFDFIPDFFTTIGSILLDKDIIIRDEDDEEHREQKIGLIGCSKESEE